MKDRRHKTLLYLAIQELRVPSSKSYLDLQNHPLMDEYEKLALQETIVLKKLQLLQDELHIIRAEMEFVRRYSSSEHQKVISEPSSEMNESETSPEQTATGKGIPNPLTPVNLVKIQTEEQSSPQMVISSPSSEKNKNEANPEQTAPGKDSTNPLEVVGLPKIQTEVQTSLTLVKPSDLSLRPNGGIPIPNKTEGHISAVPNGYKGPKAYYVVFNGSNAGIYTTWEIAEKAVKGFSGIKHKKYKSFAEAKVAANIYTTQELKPPLQLISSAEALRPTYAGAIIQQKGSSSKTILGHIPKSQPLLIQTDEDTHDIYYSEFNYLYQYGRMATEKEFVNEHFFTTDKKNVSYFNFYPNADPDMVYEAYQYGLLAQIYPANNLLEISKFPKEFRKAVKTFKNNCLKGQEVDLFIKSTSTIICWENEEEYDCPPNEPFRYIQIGAAKEKIYSPSQAVEATLEKQDLREIAEQKLLILINKLFSINPKDKLKVNLASVYTLMTSYSHKGLSDEDYNKIVAFRSQLLHKDAVGSHKELFCKRKQKEVYKFGIQHDCQICGIYTPDKASGKRIVEDPTTAAEDKELLPKIGIMLKANTGNRF